MRLQVKPARILAGRPIAIIDKETAEKLQVQEDSRIKIRKAEKRKKKWITAVVDIAERSSRKKEILLTQDAIRLLKLKKGDFVEVFPELHPYSVVYIHKKIRGKKLTFTEIYSIVSDIVRGKLREAEIAYFVSAVYHKGLDLEEITNLTKAMIKTGNVLKHDEKYVLDLHSCGGVAGNRTSPIVVSIVAAAIENLKLDAIIPKTASRAITSASGTADAMECVAKVVFTPEEIRKILQKTKGCLVWNSALGLSPADDKIVKIESMVSIDPEGQLLASVISKKVADGATHLVIEIPYGKSSKFNFKEALDLKKKFLKLSAEFGLKTKVLLATGDQPVGRGVGPVLEMVDVLAVLKNEKDKPMDLEKRSLVLASELLALTKEIRRKEAFELCKSILHSGKAYEKFKQIVFAQKGKKNFEKDLKPAKFKAEIKAKKKGKVESIDNRKISLIARIAGCPADKSAGVYLHKKKGEKVHFGEPLFTIYSEFKEKLNHAKRVAEQIEPFEIE